MKDGHSLLSVAAQLVRFAWVGVCVNVILYGVYLALTGLYFSPKVAATLVFACGIPLSFVSHSRVTFRVVDLPLIRQARFVLAYITAYLLNIAGLHLFVDIMALPHQVVQAGLIILIAGCLFLAQKFWIFGARSGTA